MDPCVSKLIIIVMVEQLQLKSNNVQWIAPEDAPYDGLELTDAE